MGKISKLSLFMMSILLAACNEQISPALQQSGSTDDSGGDDIITPDEYYFSVENASDTMLGYKLHKTGAGNANKACEVRSSTALSSTLFRGDQVANDITCFFEAEELSLFHSGFEFDIKASQNTCDFVGYMPFGFYDKIPGNSTATYWQVSCMNDETTETEIDSLDTVFYDNLLDKDNSKPACDQMVVDDEYLDPSERLRFDKPENDEDLCAFNYGSSACDIGTITIKEIQYTYTPADNSVTPTIPQKLDKEIVTRTIECGGKINNCVRGPTREFSEDSPRFTKIIETKENEDFSINYSYDGLIGAKNEDDNSYSSVKFYANYRRNLATRNIQYGTSYDLLTAYTESWSVTDPFNRIFDPKVMEYFSNNAKFDVTTPIIDSTTLEAAAKKSETYYQKPYAADPFLGLYFTNGGDYRVNPYYTFYCLDKAMEVKARIRMVVREWDRIFPTTSSDLELLSDLGRTGNSRQDTLPSEIELQDDFDQFNAFNDFYDWDDLIPMTRSTGPYNPATPTATTITPTPTGSYPNGWFNPNYFTNGTY